MKGNGKGGKFEGNGTEKLKKKTWKSVRTSGKEWGKSVRGQKSEKSGGKRHEEKWKRREKPEGKMGKA